MTEPKNEDLDKMIDQPLAASSMSAESPQDYAIDCQNVVVEYLLSSHRHSGLKDFILHHRRYLSGRKQFRALDNVTLRIPKGQSVALIGHNGCGKSTLLKTIAGVINPRTGSAAVVGRISPMIELGAGFDHELSGRENIELSCMLMGLSRKEIAARTPAIIEFATLGDFIDAPLKNYSSGMIARIGFACATAINPDILLVDEVLSVGDTNFAYKCLGRINALRETGTTVVLVSHDMGAVAKFCDRAIVLEDGQLKYDGNVQTGIAFYLDIMHARLIKSLPQDQHAEAIRMNSLRKSSFVADGPRAKASAKIIQSGTPTNELDVAKPFELAVDIVFTNHLKIGTDLTIGIAFTKDGQVITGFNNLDLNYATRYDASTPHILAKFSMPLGMPELSACAEMDILVGIHDQGLSREIFMGKGGSVKIKNSACGMNRHNYLVDLSPRISDFSIEIAGPL
jgi:lipopolysaccharide transport system ATP-binding protein